MLANLCFIFFYIHKQSQLIKLSFEKQKYEKHNNKLIERKQQIMQALQEAKKRSHIQEYAQNTLKMEKIRWNQIKGSP
jgi:hypothetical protein